MSSKSFVKLMIGLNVVVIGGLLVLEGFFATGVSAPGAAIILPGVAVLVGLALVGAGHELSQLLTELRKPNVPEVS